MSARKRKQEVQDKGGEARKRRKGEDGKAAVPDSKLDKSPKKQNGNTPDTTLQTTVPIVAPQVKVGKKAVVLNQNWNKVKVQCIFLGVKLTNSLHCHQQTLQDKDA